MNNFAAESNMGRPLAEGAPADHDINIRTTGERKGHYVRVARKQQKSLSAWMIEQCDKASKYKPEK